MSDDILISYIVSIYNKERYVGYTAQSLLKQEGGFKTEYIFVDDVSTDRSLAVIEDVMMGVPNVAIIRNTVNQGPSVRVNQGARLARGKYLQFIDSDDVLAANATQLMLSLMEEHKADIVHGGWDKTGEDIAKLVGRRVSENPSFIVSDRPLDMVFSERTRRMQQLVRRETFLAAGGCDEAVFIQDESLPLRLARAANCMILLHAPVLLIPKIEGALSGNVSQLNHDRFLASRNMLVNYPALDEVTRRRLYRRCISSAWKQKRQMSGVIGALPSKWFTRYAHSKLKLQPVDHAVLQEMEAFFAGIPNVRRMEKKP